MKILVINPNRDPDRTELIRKSAENFAKGEFEVVCRLIIAPGLAQCGISTSKIGRYSGPLPE